MEQLDEEKKGRERAGKRGDTTVDSSMDISFSFSLSFSPSFFSSFQIRLKWKPIFSVQKDPTLKGRERLIEWKEKNERERERERVGERRKKAADGDKKCQSRLSPK